MLGISEIAIRDQMSRHRGTSLDFIVRQYREGWFGKGTRSPEKHLVRGEWITVAEAAAKYGGTKGGLNHWRYKHRQPNGQIGTLAAAVDARTGVTPRARTGRKPQVYQVNGKPMTLADAACRLGCSPQRLDQIMRREGCGLATAMKKAEQLDRQRAEREILRILNGE